MNQRLRFTTQQAAEYASCHTNTVLKAAESGELHGGQKVKRGRWSFRRECLDAWLDGIPCEHHALDRAG
jgi:excisionase family DNA binding protein